MSDLPLSPAAASAWFGTPLLRRGLLALAGGLLSLLGGCAVYSSGQPVHDDYRQPLVYSQTEPVREVVFVDETALYGIRVYLDLPVLRVDYGQTSKPDVDMSLAQATHTYSILTIGDGLV